MDINNFQDTFDQFLSFFSAILNILSDNLLIMWGQSWFSDMLIMLLGLVILGGLFSMALNRIKGENGIKLDLEEGRKRKRGK